MKYLNLYIFFLVEGKIFPVQDYFLEDILDT